MKKPDRFERKLNKLVFDGESYDPFVHYLCVAKLLRAEHAWMRRMVKKVEAWSCNQLAESDDVIAVILEQLTQRRK